MKFYDINSGDILIDGISIKELSRENIHSLFTMVLQDYIFYRLDYLVYILFFQWVKH